MAFEGQFSDDFAIPAYAQDMLYVVSGDEQAPTRGKYGKSKLDQAPDGPVSIRWGIDGPMLAVWNVAPEGLNLRWDGRIKVGGFIERFHGLEVGGLEVVIAEVVGGPFPIDHVGLPSLDDMRHGIFARPSDAEPLGRDQSYPFVVLAESNLSTLVQDAMVSGLAVDAYGSLAGEAGRWHDVVGLPLLLDMLTILAP